MATSVGGVTFISQCDPVSPVSANRRHSKRKARASEAALMLWFKTFYETLSLPKLNGVAINGDFCEPPRFFHIRAADINPIDNVAVWPDHIGAIFFHPTL